MARYFLFTAFLLLLTVNLAAQTESDNLKKKRERLLTELKETTAQLDRTRSERSRALAQLTLLRKQIAQRRELVQTLEREIELTDAAQSRTTEAVSVLSGDLTELKAEYGRLLRSAHRAKLTGSTLTFLFSARSFNDAFRRFNYLRDYQAYRRRQSRLIAATEATLSSKLRTLDERRLEKEKLLTAARDQDRELLSAEGKQRGLVTELKQGENKLLAKIEQQKKAAAELQAAVERAIATEISSRRKARRDARLAAGNNTPETPAEAAAAGETTVGRAFARLRGSLTWPATGKITRRFGRQPHSEVPSVEIVNSGVDINVGTDAAIRAVFEGEVVMTRLVPENRNVVLLRHGDYYTAYANLEVVEVRQGQEVKAGDELGRTSRSDGNLHFEIWQKENRLNPETWLK